MADNTTFERKSLSQSVVLPSRGLLYEGKIPGGKIDISAISTREEKIMAGGGGTAVAKINTLLTRCVKIPQGFELEMLTSDRLYLLVMIRILSYTAEYKFRLMCQSCGQQFPDKIDLKSDLGYEYYAEDAVLTEPFAVTLPHCEHQVGFRLSRGKDELAVDKFTTASMQKSIEIGDPAYTLRIARQIMTINGQPVVTSKAQEFVETLYAPDSMALRKAIDKQECGLEFKLHRPCPRCQFVNDTDMPWEAEFFRPSIE